ncbi:hypothetical protein L1049_002474 [Liquidambar formosana]|uniref:Uncharacterized protein n=1 Tax=Liquidambar formosana TaxID=63359 RepID=A0AAP0NHW4_LIQFO
MKNSTAPSPYQRPFKQVRPPLIPSEDEFEKPEEGFFGSMGRLFLNTGSAVAEIFGAVFSAFRRKPPVQQQFQQQYHQPSKRLKAWPVQEDFVIPDEDELPSLETRTPTSSKTYPFMTKELEKTQPFKQSRAFYNGWDGDYHHQQQQQIHQQQQQKQQHHQRHYSSSPQTYYEQSCETNEIVFGAVQEQDGRREAVVIKAVDYGDPKYNNYNLRPRFNYVGYSHGY